MEHDETLGIRIPKEMMTSLELERDRASRKAGMVVPMSVVIRTLIREALLIRQPQRKRAAKRRLAASERAA